MESDDPPRKNYDFKERAFKRDNPPASAVPPVPTAQELAIMAGHQAAPPAKPERSAASRAKTGDPNDIHAVLQQNRAVERSMGRDAIEIKKKKSRRKRDYWLMLIGGNLLIVGLVALGRFNIISALFGLAGIVILSLSLTWIMWFVVDDY